MSENPNMGPQGLDVFASLMDTMAPDVDGPSAGTGEAAAAGAAGGSGAPGAEGGAAADPAPAGTAGGVVPGETAGAGAAPAGGDAAPTPGAPVAGAEGVGGGAAADGAPADAGAGSEAAGAAAGAVDDGGGAGAAGTLDHAALVPELAKLTTDFEERMTNQFRQSALEEVKEEHGQYFAALQKHPYTLVGQQVPAIGKEGMQTLQSTEDAKGWQDAVKHLLAEEITDRASRQLDANRGVLETVHASVELFQNNADLLPGTKTFDRELADRFATMAKPYELRVEDKLHGYTIPVQPLIDQLRTQIQTERSKSPSPATPAAPSATPATPPAASSPAEPPQAGIASRAGSSAEGSDFSTLFGTIGLPNLQI